MTFDLAIVGGEIVTASGRARLNVYARDGRIAELSPERHDAAETFDAGGLLVMPGMVDAHVHFMDPGDPEREDFPTGTAAAARAGVTTVVEHTHGEPVISAADLASKRDHLADRARVDFGLGAHAWVGRLDEAAGAWSAGAAFIKAFTCTTHGVPGLDAANLHELFQSAAGSRAICLIHCEDGSLVDSAERSLRASGRTDGGVIPAWRNREAELTALSVTALLARLAGARVVTAHVSHPAGIEAVARERAAGADIRIESCPQYLSLLERAVLEHGAFRKFTPPARARGDSELELMWDALRDGAIDYVSTDHAPATAEQKGDGSIWDVHFGLPGIDTTLSVLLDGAHRGRIGYERVVAAYSERPARIYGLSPRKGSLRPGADADVVIVDPEQRWTVADDDIISKAGWSPFAGRTLTGRAVRTYVRGKLAADAGEVVAAPGSGHFLPGPGAR